MIYIKTLKEQADDFKKTLVSKSGSKRSKEIRYWQRKAINEFVELVTKTYESKSSRY